MHPFGVGVFEPVAEIGIPVASLDHRLERGRLAADIGDEMPGRIGEQRGDKIDGQEHRHHDRCTPPNRRSLPKRSIVLNRMQ